eukprot:jgi/Chrzof1/10503/Cz05g01070.t1
MRDWYGCYAPIHIPNQYAHNSGTRSKYCGFTNRQPPQLAQLIVSFLSLWAPIIESPPDLLLLGCSNFWGLFHLLYLSRVCDWAVLCDSCT